MSAIREYWPEDKISLEECIVELQEAERTIESNRRKGKSVCREYLQKIVKTCKQQRGKIFVAEENGKVVGYSCIWMENKPGELISTLTEYAYVADLVVMPSFRKKGLGQALLKAAEKHARDCGMKTILLNVLARNVSSIRVYRKCGFEEYEMLLKKQV